MILFCVEKWYEKRGWSGRFATVWVQFSVSVVNPQDCLGLTKVGVAWVDLIISIMLQDSSSMYSHKPVWREYNNNIWEPWTNVENKCWKLMLKTNVEN